MAQSTATNILEMLFALDLNEIADAVYVCFSHHDSDYRYFVYRRGVWQETTPPTRARCTLTISYRQLQDWYERSPEYD